MQIWIDADACPKVIKDIVLRASERKALPVILVANHYQPKPPSPHARCVQVTAGFDVADDYIAQNAQAGDLVITADIPLAAECVAKAVHALNPRGELYTAENVRQRLAMRDFLETMRSSGVQSGGPAPLDQTDRMRFANALDKLLAKA
ncbi:MAG: YaiI/YqxD family protein [Gammaproteobacteria bacterium]|nr:YaiI/YqxD family protein [Gammaproteobacteria bacterium]